ncbi:MAG: hypothetical protein AB7V15_07905 [Acidimicrobiia bacterium]
MRTECRHYESRTYPSGDAVRKCDLDLAPEAPWRCPADCPSFERRTDVAWSWGSAVAPPTPPEPEAQGIAELLEAAEEIVNAAGPSILAEIHAQRTRDGAGGRLRKLFRRRRK